VAADRLGAEAELACGVVGRQAVGVELKDLALAACQAPVAVCPARGGVDEGLGVGGCVNGA
jgi:hypothetical protein